MAAGTADKPKSVAEKRAEKGSGRAAIDKAHEALGTGAGEVPGANIDLGPQQVHDGDDLPQSASGAPVALKLGFEVGGKKPTAAQVRIVGGKVDVPGNYRKGQTVSFRVDVKFGEVAFVDLEDKETGQVIGCDRRQKGRIVSISELEG